MNRSLPWRRRSTIQCAMLLCFGAVDFNYTLQGYVWVLIVSKTTLANMSITTAKQAGAWFNIKIPSYQHRKSHCGDKTVVRSSYLHNGISYTRKMACLYWISPQNTTTCMCYGLDSVHLWISETTALWFQGPWLMNYTHYQVWDEITYPFPNFNGSTVEVWEWTSKLTACL